MTSRDQPRVVELRSFSARTRAERLIAVCRTVLAGAALVAIWFDPLEPARFAPIAYNVLTGYLVYTVALLTWVARADVLPRRFGLWTHAVDLVVVTALQIFTEAASSPFFAFFVFALVAAALRWQQRGVVWTAPIVLAAFLTLGILAGPLIGDPTFEANRYIIRAAYLAVAGALIGYLGAHENRLRGDLSRLAGWPRHRADSSSELSSLLEYTAKMFGARMIALVWEEEEPCIHLATWSTSGFERTHMPSGTFGPIVAEALADSPFLCLDTAAAEPTVIYAVDNEVRRWFGTPVHREFQRRLGIRALMSAPLEGSSFTGRLFIIDTPRMLADDLSLISAVGPHLAAEIDRVDLVQRLQDTAALEERARVAHDLHDGMLQSLTGIELKLERLKALVDQPDVLRIRLDEISQIVSDEHAEIRSFVRALPGPTGGSGAFDFGRWLDEFSDRVSRQWDIAVKVSAFDLPSLPADLARHACLLVREAVLNAARHARASVIAIEADTDRGMLNLVITDDGRGFDFDGRREHRELSQKRLGPQSLRSRTEASRGQLAIESSPGGSRLEITLPLESR